MSQNSSKYIKISQKIMRHNWSKVPLLTTGETVGHQSMASLLPPLFKLFAKLWACLSHSDPSLKNTGNQRELEQHKPLMILNHVKKSEMKLKYNEIRWDNLAWASCYIMLYSVIKSYLIISDLIDVAPCLHICCYLSVCLFVPLLSTGHIGFVNPAASNSAEFSDRPVPPHTKERTPTRLGGNCCRFMLFIVDPLYYWYFESGWTFRWN